MRYQRNKKKPCHQSDIFSTVKIKINCLGASLSVSFHIKRAIVIIKPLTDCTTTVDCTFVLPRSLLCVVRFLRVHFIALNKTKKKIKRVHTDEYNDENENHGVSANACREKLGKALSQSC